MQTKQELRDHLMKQRLSLSDEEVLRHSKVITDHAQTLVELPNIRAIHIFEPIRELKEVEVSHLTDFLKKSHPNSTIYTSRNINDEWQIVTLDGELQHHVPSLDMVVVPMLGFGSLDLYRLGYGGGYYDYLLHGSPHAKKIGVCFDIGRLDRVPIDPHDVQLDAVVTERGTYMR